MKKALLILFAVTTCWLMATAVPAKPYPFSHVQSDGTTVTLVMRGGEFNHSLMTMDGYTVAQAPNGDYCYMASGTLSDMIAHDKDSRGLEEQAFVIAYRDQLTLAAQSRRSPRREETVSAPQVPNMGSPRIPIILVNYADVQFIDENPLFTFENQFNVMQYSCLRYFQSQSRGLFSPRFDIVGPVQLSQDRSYYGGNKRVYGQDCDKQLGTMIYEACNGVKGVDFSNYDNDGDGIVDVVVVLYAGVGEAQAYRNVPESVWPCQWDMQEAYSWGCSTSGPFQLNGVTINKFAVFNELEGYNNQSTNIDGIGTFCHEFSHCLGLPDFYPTNNIRVFGMGSWDLMDNGCYLNNGHTPAGYSSYERHFMGWMDLIEPEEDSWNEMAPLNTDEGTAYKIVNDSNANEYYLLEYRVKTGWDAYLPGQGIMILHVDYDQTAWDENTPNNESAHQRMTLIPADGVLNGFTSSTDLWPQGDKDCLTNVSTPAATVYTGGYMNKPITGMTVDQGAKLAGFWFMKLLLGDVNRDGEVTIADINALIDAILGKDIKATPSLDVNRDGELTVGDVNALVDLILKE